MKTMKDYHDLYLKCDVLLLADVFYRKELWIMSKSSFQCTRLSWDAMLKMKKIKLEVILDLDMYIFFEKRYKR